MKIFNRRHPRPASDLIDTCILDTGHQWPYPTSICHCSWYTNAHMYLTGLSHTGRNVKGDLVYQQIHLVWA